jgi:two-component system response regulator AtoC
MQGEHRASGAVLVIDDDPAMRTVLRDFLERDGHRVLEAANGSDGIVLVQSEQIDVVILDKEMPGISGLDLLAMLGRRYPSIPVILITAFGGPHVAEEARQRGALLYVEKPFRVATIVQTVQRLMQRAH